MHMRLFLQLAVETNKSVVPAATCADPANPPNIFNPKGQQSDGNCKIAVACCRDNTCFRTSSAGCYANPLGGTQNGQYTLTFSQAQTICKCHNARLCTLAQLAERKCCSKGCLGDHQYTWVRRTDGGNEGACPTATPTSPPTAAPTATPSSTPTATPTVR